MAYLSSFDRYKNGSECASDVKGPKDSLIVAFRKKSERKAQILETRSNGEERHRNRVECAIYSGKAILIFILTSFALQRDRTVKNIWL